MCINAKTKSHLYSFIINGAMVIKILLFLALITLSSCANKNYHFKTFWGEYSPTVGFEKETLTEDDVKELERVKIMGERLLVYDKFSANSTDILYKEYDYSKNIDSISGWVILNNDKGKNVCFGEWKDSSFIIKKTVQWEDGKHYFNDSIYEDETATKLMYAQRQSFMVNKDYIRREHPSSNTYSFLDGDTLTVYFIPPRKVENVFVFGGGIRTVFIDQGKKMIRNDVLQPRTVLYRDRKDLMVLWLNYSNLLIDEVDYLQIMLNAPEIQALYIINNNSPRLISFVTLSEKAPELLILKDTHRIAR